MKLLINDNTTTEKIQEVFGSLYPFLRIIFYAQETAHPQRRLVNGNVAHLLAHAEEYCFVDISGHRTVSEVEADFLSLGLQAQILRKSGSVWIETLLTRNWPLERQNHEGELLSAALAPVSSRK
ncbi:hypothetical protein [Foetidibacter luteolus]|uniref:hypothetical protein n=1 Tax=Foetidibacter luteolus TaxID=2608880 RepID=UPI00129A51B1|nr:hypothetical protein [Foetidibacter luteolus]